MNSAIHLNEIVKKESKDSNLILINLPSPPKESTIESSVDCI